MALLAADFSVDVDIAANAILAAATDFTDRRPDLWPGLSRSRYRVLQLGDGWAEVIEGTGLVWSRERYDWSIPGLVSAIQLDSNAATPGGVWQMRVGETPDGRTNVDVHIRRTSKGPLGWAFFTLIEVLGGNRFLAGQFRRTLRKIEKDAGASVRREGDRNGPG